jgi:hypothetical protein
MRAKPMGHVGPRDRAGRAGRSAMAFVMLGIDCALASASDLAGLGTPPWLFPAYHASVFLVLYAQSP